MVNKDLISGIVEINGAKYITIRRFNVILIIVVGIIAGIFGSLNLPNFIGAFLLGAGLTACFIGIEQLGNAYIGYKKIK